MSTLGPLRITKRNFDNFEEGKWYVYTGKKTLGKWNNSGFMDYVLDNKPRQCLAAYDEFTAQFSDDEILSSADTGLRRVDDFHIYRRAFWDHWTE